MEQSRLLSVVVPVYNVESYLSRCLDSILGQTYPFLEVILVNDGSKDASGSICDRYAEQDPRVRVIHKENGGLSSARNAGINAATGTYITFVDSDDWIEADGYAHLMGLMEQYQVKLVCGGNYDVDDETGVKTLGICPQKEELITTEEMVRRMFLWQGCDSSACDKITTVICWRTSGIRRGKSARMWRLPIESFWGQTGQSYRRCRFTTIFTGRAALPWLQFRRTPSTFPSILRKSTPISGSTIPGLSMNPGICGYARWYTTCFRWMLPERLCGKNIPLSILHPGKHWQSISSLF